MDSEDGHVALTAHRSEVAVAGLMIAAIFFVLASVVVPMFASPTWSGGFALATSGGVLLAVLCGLRRKSSLPASVDPLTASIDLAVMAAVVAAGDPLVALVVGIGALALIGSVAALYASAHAFFLHLVAASAISVAIVTGLHPGQREIFALLLATIAVGMHLLTRILWNEVRTEAAYALIDPLTGVFNRAGLNRAFRQYSDLSARGDGVLAVVAVDVDRFKAVNDTCGHATGDRVLIEVSADLSRHFGQSSTVGRTGGEEFVVLVQGHESVVRSMVEAMPLTTEGLNVPHVTMSAGASWCDLAVRRPTLKNALIHADWAMYSAKRNGGGQLHSLL